MFTFEIIMYPHALEPPFDYLDLTPSDQLSLVSLLTISISHFLWEGRQNKGKGTQGLRLRSASQPTYLRDITPHPIYHVSTTKVRSAPRHSAMLEECFTCVSKYSFSMHPPWSSLCISLTRWGGKGYLIKWGGGGFRVILPLLWTV